MITVGPPRRKAKRQRKRKQDHRRNGQNEKNKKVRVYGQKTKKNGERNPTCHDEGKAGGAPAADRGQEKQTFGP